MLRASGLALAAPNAIDALSDDWVIALLLNEPMRMLPGSMRWAELGSLRGFFSGLLFDRQRLTAGIDRAQEYSDADLVLRAYERSGEVALSQLRGSFALAIIDQVRGTALVARDQMGSHPLFYAEVGSRALFASSPQPLLEQAGVSRALNRAALADHLCHRWPDPHETFFAAVRRVAPGSCAVISRGRLHLKRCWDPMPEDRPVQWLTVDEVARFDQVFDQAIDRCLGNGPTGIFLSGGLDSISVAAFATDCARRIGHNLPLALSLGFPDPACDERDRQAAVARDLGLRQHLIDIQEAVGSRPLLEQSLELNRELSAPLLNTYKPAYLALARLARRDGVRSILTGQGGDEWLGVTPLLAANLIRRGAVVELAQLYGTFRRSYPAGSIATARQLLWTWGLRPLAGMMRHRFSSGIHRGRRIRRLLAG